MLRRRSPLLQASKKLSPQLVVDSLKRRGTGAFFGCPDYHLRHLTAYLSDHTNTGEYVTATNSGNAMAMAAGHYLSTLRTPCVLMQNGGLGDAMNPVLTLFNQDAYRLPCLMLISWRGKPETSDEEAMPGLVAQGRMTEHCLTAVDIPFSIIGDSADIEMNWDVVMDKAYYHMSNEKTPFAILVEPDTLEEYTPHRPDADPLPPAPLELDNVVDQVCRQFNATDAFVCGCGSVQAALRRARGQRAEAASAGASQDFLLADSVGHTCGVAVGVAVSRPGQQVVCLEGDGAALTHLNGMATVGGLNALKDAKTGAGLLRNLKHIVVNDGVYASAGGQSTAALDVSLTGVATACGYFAVRDEPVVELGDLVSALAELRQCDGPAFLEVVVNKSPTARPKAEARRDLLLEKQSFADFMMRSRP
ncbi:phosphonopyruvate decarboxylase-like protein [Leptomonas pyrrhocoris]|uniref:Phosphonopyruvate decarboxylase-like protein n=1 Tax=Leptomonas pyrrhocoris TaxID=157538 RepID=A0A0N0DZH8_LEPPY|nr:phosphonopyruvate decarboxylase-like protein [Leptomonas pyrrhocoris]KPA85311.1 phosphonopyruvate decarboxylase-like protein [Leptomonas pyrrhocoris]|eukprot:XP_015663750.1 phosphonopyruvate decarboxylase-like protein [Leptomonas pyrrhocoris]